jgi:hypothetical protein
VLQAVATVPKPAHDCLSHAMKTGILVVSLAAGGFGQGQQPGMQEQPVIQDPVQLVGKKINVKRLPLCEPGTYKGGLRMLAAMRGMARRIFFRRNFWLMPFGL